MLWLRWSSITAWPESLIGEPKRLAPGASDWMSIDTKLESGQKEYIFSNVWNGWCSGCLTSGSVEQVRAIDSLEAG